MLQLRLLEEDTTLPRCTKCGERMSLLEALVNTAAVVCGNPRCSAWNKVVYTVIPRTVYRYRR